MYITDIAPGQDAVLRAHQSHFNHEEWAASRSLQIESHEAHRTSRTCRATQR